MTLTHTAQAGYTYHPDVYTDEHERSFAVYPDTDSEDPRTWFTVNELAIIVINGDRNTHIDTLTDYKDNPAIACFIELLDELDTDDPYDVSIDVWRAALHEQNLNYDVALTTCQGYSQSDWFTALVAVKDEYGTAENYVDTYRMWAFGDVWTVVPVDPEPGSEGPLSGIYADDPESAVIEYINYMTPKEVIHP